MPFDAVLFDAGGVLVIPDPEVLGPIVARFGGSDDAEQLTRAHFAGAFAYDRTAEDVEDWPSYARGYAEAAGVPADRVEEAAAALAETLDHEHWRTPFPGAIETLRALHQRGVPIGVVSNAGGQIERTLLDQAICQVGGGDHAPVLCVIDSHVVGVAKPDPAIFSHALPFLGLDPGENIAYVGDTVYNDVRGAEAAGLTPLLHDPYGYHATGPHRTLRRLEDLLGLV
jgi:putative hydrolase of the HAD superfamily